MNEIFEIDYENPEEVLVSDNKDLPIEQWTKAIPIGFLKTCDNDIVIIVASSTYDIIFPHYKYWQQIPEKKFRPSTWEEALPILERAWINDSMASNGWGKVSYINLSGKYFYDAFYKKFNEHDLINFKYKFNITDEAKKFEVEV